MTKLFLVENTANNTKPPAKVFINKLIIYVQKNE
ncbi:MAG: hypothetical protein ACI9L6_000272 [Flavobacterium sp.]|jgi:hypothetical protein